MSSQLRSMLRAKTVGAKKIFKSEAIEFEGETFEIRQPTVAQKSAIMQAANMQVDGDKITNMDMGSMQVWSVICCTYVPGESDPVFMEEDAEVLLESPAGGFVDKFGAIAQKLMNLDTKKIEKNLESTQKDS